MGAPYPELLPVIEGFNEVCGIEKGEGPKGLLAGVEIAPKGLLVTPNGLDKG